MDGGQGRGLKAVLLCPWCGASQECDLAKPCQARGTDQQHVLSVFYPGKHLSLGRSSLAANIRVADGHSSVGAPSPSFPPLPAPSPLLASSHHSHFCASCPASLHPPQIPPPVPLSSAKHPAPSASSAIFPLVFHVFDFFFLMFSSL